MKKIFIGNQSSCALPFILPDQSYSRKSPAASSRHRSQSLSIQATYDKTTPQLHAYRDALEADGLSTYILRDDWRWQTLTTSACAAHQTMRKNSQKRSPLESVV